MLSAPFEARNDGTFIDIKFQTANGNPVVYWDEIKTPDNSRGGNFRQFTDETFEIYRRNGYDAVLLHAGYDVGPYVWARAGFRTTQGEWDKVRGNMLPRVDRLTISDSGKATLRDILQTACPVSLTRLAKAPGGKDLLTMRGSKEFEQEAMWFGFFRLNDPGQNAIFNDYMARR